MVNIDLVYEGGLHCKLKHEPSGMEITTDAPKDNMGKGAAFSPTDLVAAGVLSCMVTTMAIFAARHNIALEGVRARVTKEMITEPRRIGRLPITIEMPGGIEASMRAALERAALACPAHKSLSSDVEIPVKFQYAS